MNKIQYETESKKLFKKWKNLKHHKNNGFVSDGIVDFDKWRKSNKILVLLKEAHGGKEYDGKDWLLANLIDCGNRNWIKKDQHYKMLSMWLYVLNNTTEEKYPKNINFNNKLDEAYEYLLSSAVINIKKCCGMSQSNEKEIYNYAIKDRELLRKQIELISPNIILCGNTCYPLLNGIYEIDDYTQYYYSYHCIYYNKMTIIDFRHPSRTQGREIRLCNELGKDYQKYLKILK